MLETGVPLFGNALEFTKEPHLIPVFNRWAKEYGPIVRFNLLGAKQVLISSDKVANDLFAKRGNLYSDRGVTPAMQIYGQGRFMALMPKNGE